jgi:hypothetical protein
MRTITRTGVTLSVVAALALYGVQLVAALGVALGVVFTGALAGLCVAKWLQRDWYGRQFSAGARAGAIACGVGGFSSLLYLLGQGPRTVTDLAARSHLVGVDLAPVVTALDSLGWTGVDIVVISGAIVAGIILSGIIALIAGWSKSARAVRVVAQARLAAQALQHADGRASATAGPRSATAGPQLFATGAPGSAALHAERDWEGLGLPGASSPVLPLPRRSAVGAADAPRAAASPKIPAEPTVPFIPAAHRASTHRPSDARATREALTEEARSALSKWDDELDAFEGFDGLEGLPDDVEEGDATQKPRAVNPSTFLTEPPPAKPRKRKRQDTGDWLC